MIITIGGKNYDTSKQSDWEYICSTIFNPNSSYFDQKMYDAAMAGQFSFAFRDRLKEYENAQSIINQGTETGDYTQVQGSLANIGYTMTPDTEKWLDNMIAQQNTQADRDFQTTMRDTSLTSAASQLEQLGLSSSNVVQVGGSSSGVSSSAASQNMHSNAGLRQQARINDFNQKMGIAKSLIGAAGSMASSGIYGAAIGAVKHSAQALASSTAHSALNVLKNSHHPQELVNQLAKNGNDYMFNNLFGQ